MALGDSNVELIQRGFDSAPAWGKQTADYWDARAPLTDMQKSVINSLNWEDDSDAGLGGKPPGASQLSGAAPVPTTSEPAFGSAGLGAKSSDMPDSFGGGQRSPTVPTTTYAPPPVEM